MFFTFGYCSPECVKAIHGVGNMYTASTILIKFLMDISLLGEQTKSTKLANSLGELMAKNGRHQ
ncbi:uncharacterized protein ACA1_035500 [Acanthamoeba castellanii str. Neff]|uniref:Uncharacterized protein n=1 Tax=Acanthamoeba castellanii (strain ATCC 30010 / Neff) TaxID=1257118 RepID=L8HAL0_ACACF|nr:uncharacterized protein ACA1_035500 [Acanthamoeba castellanii str. Neff]ELR22220.1 hypothetical protein ACA1_035500 [Acanthamoeba castellanii str. Neff]